MIISIKLLSSCQTSRERCGRITSFLDKLPPLRCHIGSMGLCTPFPPRLSTCVHTIVVLTYVIAGFEHMGCEGVTHLVPRLRVDPTSFLKEHKLLAPGASRIGLFASQGVWHLHLAIAIGKIASFALSHVRLSR